ncbi:MAG: hypothetical protein JWP62_2585 [Blastococcus sp.]|jgi:hypothetical protein|nr:hypothetical protein [Blastococcus sp.]
MPARTVPPAATPHGHSPNRIARLLATTALIVLALGILPVVWHASVVWQIVGPVVSLALVVHTTQVIWREAFSTHPRHLSGSV